MRLYLGVRSTRGTRGAAPEAAARLGHAQTSTTMDIYAHARRADDAVAVAALEAGAKTQ